MFILTYWGSESITPSYTMAFLEVNDSLKNVGVLYAKISILVEKISLFRIEEGCRWRQNV